jgi:hypothetical protein
MRASQTAFMGVDPSIQSDLIAYAVIDNHLHPIKVGIGDLDEVMAIVDEQQPAVIGVGAPSRLNQGIMADPVRRAELGISPRRGRPMECRVAEYELLQRDIYIYRTPSQERKAKPWMGKGFTLYGRLKTIGFHSFTGNPKHQQFIEVSPETCYWIWLAGKPMAANTLEGRIQRQLILYELGMDIPDPMLLFEEITRFRLLQGILLEEGLYPPAELQALAGAYISWAMIQRPDEVSFVGDIGEGQIVVPNKFEQG